MHFKAKMIWDFENIKRKRLNYAEKGVDQHCSYCKNGFAYPWDVSQMSRKALSQKLGK